MLPVCGLGKGRKASLLIFMASTHVQFHLSDEQHWGRCYNKAYLPECLLVPVSVPSMVPGRSLSNLAGSWFFAVPKSCTEIAK